MNHPSDYMPQYRHSSSSDQSSASLNLAFKPTLQKPSSYSFHHPNKPKNANPKKSAKTKKSCKGKLQAKLKEKQKHQSKQRAESDYLILDGSFYSCKDAIAVSSRLIEKPTIRIMQPNRLKLKEKKCISKIEKYMATFLQQIREKSLINSISYRQKVELYQLLKLQQQQHRVQKICQSQNVEHLMKVLVNSLQQKAEKLEEKYPEEERLVSKWKNFKLHQLMAAQTFIKRQEQSLESSLSLNLESELAILKQEEFYPELKEQAEELQASILKHLDKKQNPKQIEDSCQQDVGVKWVLDSLLAYLAQKPDALVDVLMRLDKINQGYQVFGGILTDQLYIQFEKQEIGTGTTEQEEEQHTFIHIFNKAVFDLFNQNAPKFLSLYQGIINQECLLWLFQRVSIKEEEKDEQIDVKQLSQLIMDGLLEETLWQFLDLL